MSYLVNGQKLSYDYEEMIGELKSDIEAGLIKTSTLINIVRAREPFSEEVNYRPIIDFYYDQDIENMSLPLASLYDKNEYSAQEWQEMEEKQKKMLEQYTNDQQYFEKHTVMAILTEMEQWNSII